MSGRTTHYHRVVDKIHHREIEEVLLKEYKVPAGTVLQSDICKVVFFEGVALVESRLLFKSEDVELDSIEAADECFCDGGACFLEETSCLFTHVCELEDEEVEQPSEEYQQMLLFALEKLILRLTPQGYAML